MSKPATSKPGIRATTVREWTKKDAGKLEDSLICGTKNSTRDSPPIPGNEGPSLVYDKVPMIDF